MTVIGILAPEGRDDSEFKQPMKKRILPRSIKFKILFLLLSGVVVSIALSFFIEMHNSKRRLQEDVEKHLEVVSSAIYPILEHTMAEGRPEKVPDALRSLTRSPAITDIALLDRDMKERFRAGRDEAVRERRDVTIPVRSRELCRKCHGGLDPIGYLRIGFEVSGYRERFYERLFWNLGGSIVLLAVISAIVFVCLQKGVFSRLKMFDRAMKSFGRGNLHEQIRIKGNDEFADLAMVFNEMANNIFSINYRLFRVSEFSTFLCRKETEDEVFSETVRFLKGTFSLNGAGVFLNEPDGERLVSLSGELDGLLYSEPLVVDMKEIGAVKVAVSRDLTVNELSALKLISSVSSALIERIRQAGSGCRMS